MIEGQDYFVRRVRFPNTANWAAVTPNDDGTFDIYINDALDDEKQVAAFLHELAHLERDHFYVCACAAACERQIEDRKKP